MYQLKVDVGMSDTVKNYWPDVSSVSPPSFRPFVLSPSVLWRRAKIETSAQYFFTVFNILSSIFSWYNLLFCSLRGQRSTLVLTGTSILLYLEPSYVPYHCRIQREYWRTYCFIAREKTPFTDLVYKYVYIYIYIWWPRTAIQNFSFFRVIQILIFNF